VSVLPLYPGSSPCLRSGYCCKTAACPFGTWDEVRHQCAHLGGGRPGQYACLIAAEIMGKPGWEMSPAFGAGCCSPGNSDHQKLRHEQDHRKA